MSSLYWGKTYTKISLGWRTFCSCKEENNKGSCGVHMIECDKCNKHFPSAILQPMGLHHNIIAKICYWCYDEWSRKFHDLELTSIPTKKFDVVWIKTFNEWLVSGKEKVVFN